MKKLFVAYVCFTSGEVQTTYPFHNMSHAKEQLEDWMDCYSDIENIGIRECTTEEYEKAREI